MHFAVPGAFCCVWLSIRKPCLRIARVLIRDESFTVDPPVYIQT